MSKPLAPEEHSDLVGGSTAARRIGCPRSWSLEKQSPPDTGNSIYAREGTALHAILAVVVGEEREPLDLLPYVYTDAKEGWSYEVDEVTWAEKGEPALAAFDRFVADLEKEEEDRAAVWVETRCAMPGIEGAFGTTDVLIRCGKTAVVWDWKMGTGPVYATDNAQLQFYARAAAEDVTEVFSGVDRIGLAIMQPAVNSERPDVWWTDFDQLERFRQELIAAVEEARKGDAATIRKGAWCRFAPCKAICPLWVGQSLLLAEKLAAASVRTNDGKPKVDVRMLDNLTELLDLADAASEWASALRAAAHAHAEAGNPIEGWMLVQKKSSGRDWTAPEGEVKKWFKNRSFLIDDYMPRKLLTPPAAEKLLKTKGRELPEELVVKRASSGTNLVREGSSREAFVPTADRVAQLAAALKPHLED